MVVQSILVQPPPSLMKMVGNAVFLCFYAIFCYLKLIFRMFIPPKMKSLDGEIFLITGSASGIGREVAKLLAQNHPNTVLVLWDINGEENRNTADLVRSMGANVYQYDVDITNRTEVECTALKVREDVGNVTILFNNAGVMTHIQEFLSTNPEELEKVIQVNLISHFWTISAFLPAMIELNHGHIVTTASMGSYFGLKYGAAYFASKHAIRGMIESIQDEMRIHSKKPDIKFTTIFPLFTKTRMTEGITFSSREGKEDKRLWTELDNVASRIIDGIRRDQEKVMIPKLFEVVILLKAISPSALYWKAFALFFGTGSGYEEESKISDDATTLV